MFLPGQSSSLVTYFHSLPSGQSPRSTFSTVKPCCFIQQVFSSHGKAGLVCTLNLSFGKLLMDSMQSRYGFSTVANGL